MIINLHGKLAEHIGKSIWNLKVKSVGEAIRAIDANTNKLCHYLADAKNKDIGYEIVVDGKTCDTAEEVAMYKPDNEINIIPRIFVSKGNVGKIIAGIVLLVVAWYVIPLIAPGLAASGPGWGTAASNAIGGGFWGSVSNFAANLGMALILGGIYQLIIGSPEVPVIEDNSSFLFSGPVNTSRQGNPVPIVYGEVICGSQVIDVSVINDKYEEPTEPELDEFGVPVGEDEESNESSSTADGGVPAPETHIYYYSLKALPVKSYNVIDPNLEIII